MSLPVPSAPKRARLPGFWAALLSPLLALGCVSVNGEADQEIAAERMPRPAVILVSDFAVAPEEVDPTRFSGTRLIRDNSPTATERAVGHRFAGTFATTLVDEIRKMGLPAERAGAPLAPGGPILSVEGQFISLASGGPTAPGVIGFTADWANVVADIEIYDRSKAGDRLSEDLEFDLADANQPPERMPSGVLTKLHEQSTGLGSPEIGLPPETAAGLDAAAAATARVAAKQLATYFADQGWIQPGQASS
jgi:Domain of unknown function (DUF4410)